MRCCGPAVLVRICSRVWTGGNESCAWAARAVEMAGCGRAIRRFGRAHGGDHGRARPAPPGARMLAARHGGAEGVDPATRAGGARGAGLSRLLPPAARAAQGHRRRAGRGRAASPGLTTPEAADPGAGPRALTPAPRIGPCAAVGGCMRGAVGVVPARGATHRPQGQPAGSQPPSDGRNRGPWANTPLPRVAAPCREPPSPAPVQGPCRELCVAGPRREPRVAGPRREPCAAGPDRHGRGSARRGEHHLRHSGRRARPNPAGQRLA